MIINLIKFKELLKNNDLTKSKLGEKLNISSRTLAKIGKGEDISHMVVEKICKYLCCNENALIRVNEILETLKREKNTKLDGGLYHMTQIKLTYNSNHIEGSTLTEDQTRYIFETNTVGNLTPDIKLDDVVETNNHFKCVDYVIEHANDELSEEMTKALQKMLKVGTVHSTMYKIGEYKEFSNTVGGNETCTPKNVAKKMKKMICDYIKIKQPTFEEIVSFHKAFETIHPFQDGNGRVGRLIAFKECLKNNIVPFYIEDSQKWLYYHGLKEWDNEPNYLIETCRFGQDQFKQILDYFDIKY